MKLNSVHHIAIIVSDIEKAREFYVDKLSFEVIRENYRKERDDWKLDLRVDEHTELEIFAEKAQITADTMRRSVARCSVVGMYCYL